MEIYNFSWHLYVRGKHELLIKISNDYASLDVPAIKLNLSFNFPYLSYTIYIYFFNGSKHM